MLGRGTSYEAACRLPRRRAGKASLPAVPKAQFDHRVAIAAPPPAVWSQMQQPDTWAGLGPIERIWDPEWEDGTLCSYRWEALAGPRKVEGVATTRQALPEELMVIDLNAGNFSGLLTTELSLGVDDHTDVHVVLAIETTDVMLSLVFPIVADAIRKALPGQVEGLAAKIERTVG